MRATNKNLTLLSEAERSALYTLPDFDSHQRLEYLTLTEPEQKLMHSRHDLSGKIYCALQIGYFKAKQLFFRFTWEEAAPEDMNFICQRYFSEQILDPQFITKHEHYVQCHAIAALFSYQLWSKRFEPLVRQKINQIILRDINPQFIMMELLSFFMEKKIIRPRYTTLQLIVSDTLSTERQRLKNLLNAALDEETKSALQKLLLEENTLSGLAALKQDAKDFKARMMMAEREKLMTIGPLYHIAKMLLPKLELSKQNIHYYASLIHYYTIHDLRERIQPERTYLYLLCYLWLRYQQINDNLVEAFCYQQKKFEEETKEKAEEKFTQYALSQQNEWLIMKCLARFYVDESLPDKLSFGEVRQQVFTIVPKDELRNKVGNGDEKPIQKIDFKWKIIDQLAHRFKHHLRPLAITIDFTSTSIPNPWLTALQWFRSLFSQQKNLQKTLIGECPENTIPKRLRAYLLETRPEGVTLQAERYEFWIYRQLRKRFKAGELYLEDSIHHRSLNQELVSLTEKEVLLQQLDIPAFKQPIEQQIDQLFFQLNELWLTLNQHLSQGKLNHLRYDHVTKTLHRQKFREDKEEPQHHFYAQLPLRDITDILQFVNEQCQFLSTFTHIQSRYAKESVDDNSLIAAIIAQGMNHGNLNMAEISDIPYDRLQEAYQARIRLATLKAANDMISDDIARMPIFSFYSFDFLVLYGGVDGQKYDVENPTIKARNSKKYFKKGRGVVAYTLLANHIPLQVKLIGAHEHESYFAFDIWHNNTSEVTPDVITGDMHCVNKANFAIMHWFGGKLFPRFTDINAELKHLYSGCDPSEYAGFLIQPVAQLNRQLIKEEWSNLQRIIATLALKEMTQSTLIKKLCTYTPVNRTRKALFEFDKLIRSIHTLNYLLDPKISRDTHRSQNRVESYHQLRAAIAQAYGKKELAGRTDIAIEISNQCGRLIANAIIHYNSAILSKLREKCESENNLKALKILKKISPAAWRHIHFQGHFVFSDQRHTIDLDAMVSKLTLD